AGSAYGTTTLTHIDELLVTGPAKPTGVSDTASRHAIFTCRPASGKERACAQTILSRLAAQAYRRPVTPGDVADLMKVYDEAAAKDGFEVGVRTGLQAILLSPKFLFRLERMPAAVQAGKEYRLNDVDLATRLSFFLWAAPPDKELLDMAARGRLADPAT